MMLPLAASLCFAWSARAAPVRVAPPDAKEPPKLPTTVIAETVLKDPVATPPAEPVKAPTALTTLEMLAPEGAAPPAEPDRAGQIIDGSRPVDDDGPSQLYIYPKTFESKSSLGPVAQVLHYGLELGFQAGVIYSAFHMGGLGAAATALIVQGPRIPLSITLQSSADLGIRYWHRKRKLLKSLARQPGVTSLKVLSGSETRFQGLIAQSQISNGLVIAESTRPLPEDPALGKPRPASPESTRFELRFSIGQTASPVVWTPTLAEILAGKAMPRDVSRAWRRIVAKRLRDVGLIGLWLGRGPVRDARISIARLDGPNGQPEPLGLLAQCRSALKVVGGVLPFDRALAIWRVLRARVRRTFALPLAIRSGRPVPLTQTRVVDRPTRRRPKRWLDLLFGREVVRLIN